MRQYFNPFPDNFQMALNTPTYVDKSLLITHTNQLICTSDRYLCVSRGRRFGKTMALNMLAAYYGQQESQSLFENLKIAQDPSFTQHLQQYNVILINLLEFVGRETNTTITNGLAIMQSKIISEIAEAFPDLSLKNPTDFLQVMYETYYYSKKPFIILIDEWDCIFREFKEHVEDQKYYLNFLRAWLKDQPYVGLAYMTGILPIKKYGTNSSLNMFDESTMINPMHFMPYFGFMTDEVEHLCEKFNMNMDEMRLWYNGYFLEFGLPIYNPTAVTKAIKARRYSNYWSQTETVESLRDYISFNFNGIKSKITLLIANEEITIDPHSFINDFQTFNCADDILTLFVHLAYLTFNSKTNTVIIPNKEVREEFITAIKDNAGC